jgi:hypothetical protein
MLARYSVLYAKVLRAGLAIIMVIAPFYAPLSVWLASQAEHFDFWKIWKEFALTLLGLVMLSFLVTHHKFVRRILHNKLVLIVLAYVLLVLAYGAYDLLTHRVSNDAVIYGLIVDLRPVAIFGVAFLTFAIAASRKLAGFPWRKLVLIPAAIVIIFGLLQMFILPKDILTHVGYGENTILPYQTVDNQPDIVRVQSFLRGSNPLGAYLIFIIVLLVVMYISDKKRRVWWAVFTAGAVILMVGTYSRSAQLGLILSLLALAFVYQQRFVKRHLLIVGAAVAIVVLAGIVAVAKNNYIAENFIFHTSDRSRSVQSSNSERLAAMERGAEDMINNPFGTGVGSAGPASARNELGEVRIAENYYIQLGQELGVAGMLLFITFNIMVAIELWRRRAHLIAKVLLASLVGITFVNMLSHAWTDDTLAYIWWTLAGFALAPLLVTAANKKASIDK